MDRRSFINASGATVAGDATTLLPMAAFAADDIVVGSLHGELAAGMSDGEVARTAELILEINRQHALVVVEHDMDFIRMIAKKVTLLHQGAIVCEDTPDRIMNDPPVKQLYLGKKAH